jgi:acetyl-CoA synthetase
MYLIMKKMIFFGVPLILVGLLDICILYGPLLNGATIVIFLVSLRILIIVVLEVIEKHKVTQFYTAPTAIRALAKENIEFVQNIH